MAIALPIIWDTRREYPIDEHSQALTLSTAFYRRPIFALLMMILEPGKYDPSPHDQIRPGLSGWDHSRLELEADYKDALRIVNRILGAHQLTPASVNTEMGVLPPDYFDASDETIDLSCLEIFN